MSVVDAEQCPMLTTVLAVNPTLLQRYSLIKLLSGGKSGAFIFLVKEKSTGEVRILKFYPDSVCSATHEIRQERPFREALTLCALQHIPGYPKLFEYGLIRLGEWDDRLRGILGLYVIMSLSEGTPLFDLDVTQLSGRDIVGIAIHLLGLLLAAQKALGPEFQHFDFHPDNIFVSPKQCSTNYTVEGYTFAELCPKISIIDFDLAGYKAVDDKFGIDHEQTNKINSKVGVPERTLTFLMKLVPLSVLLDKLKEIRETATENTDVRNWYLIIWALLYYKEYNSDLVKKCRNALDCFQENVAEMNAAYQDFNFSYALTSEQLQHRLDNLGAMNKQIARLMEQYPQLQQFVGDNEQNLIQFVRFADAVKLKSGFYPTPDSTMLRYNFTINRPFMLTIKQVLNIDYSLVHDINCQLTFKQMLPVISVTFRGPLRISLGLGKALSAGMFYVLQLINGWFYGWGYTAESGMKQLYCLGGKGFEFVDLETTPLGNRDSCEFATCMDLYDVTISMKSPTQLVVKLLISFKSYADIARKLAQLNQDKIGIKVEETYNVHKKHPDVLDEQGFFAREYPTMYTITMEQNLEGEPNGCWGPGPESCQSNRLQKTAQGTVIPVAKKQVCSPDREFVKAKSASGGLRENTKLFANKLADFVGGAASVGGGIVQGVKNVLAPQEPELQPARVVKDRFGNVIEEIPAQRKEKGIYQKLFGQADAIPEQDWLQGARDLKNLPSCARQRDEIEQQTATQPQCKRFAICQQILTNVFLSVLTFTGVNLDLFGEQICNFVAFEGAYLSSGGVEQKLQFSINVNHLYLISLWKDANFSMDALMILMKMFGMSSTDVLTLVLQHYYPSQVENAGRIAKVLEADNVEQGILTQGFDYLSEHYPTKQNKLHKDLDRSLAANNQELYNKFLQLKLDEKAQQSQMVRDVVGKGKRVMEQMGMGMKTAKRMK